MNTIEKQSSYGINSSVPRDALSVGNRRPWEVDWGVKHGDVIPKDITGLILNLLKPFQLLIMSQVTRGWKQQIDEQWTIIPHIGNEKSLNEARDIWNRFTKSKLASYVAMQKENVQQLSFQMKHICAFTNEKFIEVTALYRNLFSRFHEFTLEEATYVFHQKYGMKQEYITKIFLKIHTKHSDIQLGNLNCMKELPLDSKHAFVSACIDSNRVELVMTRMDSVSTDEQGHRIHDYLIDLMSGPVENISSKLSRGGLEPILKDFFFKAKQELQNNPNSLLSAKLKPVIDVITQGAWDWACENGTDFADAVFALQGVVTEFYCAKWLFGFGWGMTLSRYLAFDGLAILGGVTVGAIEYYMERTRLILQTIPLLPEYANWERELLHLAELYEVFFKVRGCLDHSNYCTLSKKLLVHAVRAPDGKSYDLEAIVKELEVRPQKYKFDKKDLVPDFKKINQIYNNLIEFSKNAIDEKRASLLIVRNIDKAARFLRFSANFFEILELLRVEKRRSFEKVYLYYTEEQKTFLKQHKKSVTDDCEGKISKEIYEKYKKYEKIKAEIDYKYNYSLEFV